MLAGEGHLHVVGIIVVGTIAELIGSFVAYGAGRAGGWPLVHRFGRYLLITRADIDRTERFMAGRGVWSIPLGRALPVIRTFVSIVAGIVEVPPLLFGVLNLIGTAVWVTVMSLIGYGVGSGWHSIATGDRRRRIRDRPGGGPRYRQLHRLPAARSPPGALAARR